MLSRCDSKSQIPLNQKWPGLAEGRKLLASSTQRAFLFQVNLLQRTMDDRWALPAPYVVELNRALTGCFLSLDLMRRSMIVAVWRQQVFSRLSNQPIWNVREQHHGSWKVTFARTMACSHQTALSHASVNLLHNDALGGPLLADPQMISLWNGSSASSVLRWGSPPPFDPTVPGSSPSCGCPCPALLPVLIADSPCF